MQALLETVTIWLDPDRQSHDVHTLLDEGIETEVIAHIKQYRDDTGQRWEITIPIRERRNIKSSEWLRDEFVRVLTFQFEWPLPRIIRFLEQQGTLTRFTLSDESTLYSTSSLGDLHGYLARWKPEPDTEDVEEDEEDEDEEEDDA